MLEGVGQLQTREKEHGLQKLLQLVECLHIAGVNPTLLDQQVDVLGKPLTHLQNIKSQLLPIH